MKTLNWTPDTPNTGGWQDRHRAAIAQPITDERPIVAMLTGWLDYAKRHGERCESGIGEDYVLGPEWEAIGRGIRGLLNGETGRLDCGTLNSIILDNLTEQGFPEE